MKKRLIIIGAGGHARVCAETAVLCGYNDIVFLADDPSDLVTIAGPTDSMVEYLDDSVFFVGIGDNSAREKFFEKIRKLGGTLVALIHPQSAVSSSAKIGIGTVVMPGAVINAGAKIGDGVIINTCASADHDCVIGDFSHVSVGAHLAGTVTLGKRVFIGAGATVINNVSVCDNVIVGAGGVAVKSIEVKGTYIGVPVRIGK